ncbi:MAG: hypothetical protein KC502_21500, partial [Myxococcales bacterium]|nr:hypothetical protein [Myxococcales bacterium]
MRTRSDRPNLRRRHASRWPALLATVTISLSACTSPTTAEPDATPDAAAPDIATTDSLPLTDSRLPDTTPADTTSPDTSAPDSVDAAAEVSPVVVPPELNPGALKVLPDHGYLDPPPNFATVRLADPKAAPGVCTWHIGPPSVCATHPGGNKPTFAVASKTGGGTCVVTCLIDGAPFARVHLKAPWQTVIYVVGSGSSANGLDRRIDRFLSARGVWQQGVAYLPEKRYNPMIGFWKGRLYVIGGTTTGSKYDLQYEPATFPWHCPEVIDESGGTDVGCRAIRALRLGPEFGWNSKVAELPFGRSGYSVQIGSQLWLLGGEATTDAQMQSELKGMAAQVFDMEGQVFLPPAFPAANLKTSWHHSFPWNGL